MISDERLSELERLATAATPGWWAWADDGDRRICIGAASKSGSPIEGEDSHGVRCEVLEDGVLRPQDAAFIVASRAAVPELIAEVRSQREELEREGVTRRELSRGLSAILERLHAGWWITEGRGPYEWDDDRYREETRVVLEEVMRLAGEALLAAGRAAGVVQK